jgi:hypothetical protein
MNHGEIVNNACSQGERRSERLAPSGLTIRRAAAGETIRHIKAIQATQALNVTDYQNLFRALTQELA